MSPLRDAMRLVDGEEANSDFLIQRSEKIEAGTGSEFRRHVANAVITVEQFFSHSAHLRLRRAEETSGDIRDL